MEATTDVSECIRSTQMSSYPTYRLSFLNRVALISRTAVEILTGIGLVGRS